MSQAVYKRTDKRADEHAYKRTGERADEHAYKRTDARAYKHVYERVKLARDSKRPTGLDYILILRSLKTADNPYKYCL